METKVTGNNLSPIDDSALQLLDKNAAREKRIRQAGQEVVTNYRINQIEMDYNARYNADGDSYSPTSEKAKGKSKEKVAQQRRDWANRLLGAFMAAAIATGTHATVQAVSNSKGNFDATGHSLVEVSDWTGVDINALYMANEELNSDEIIEGKISVPEEFDYMQEEISELEQQISDRNFEPNEEQDLEAKLEFLKEKQEVQKDMAKVYISQNGKTAYIITNHDVPAEDLKDAFGIKSGVIRKHNPDLEFEWGRDESLGDHTHYKDYSDTKITGTIKIPAKELGKAF